MKTPKFHFQALTILIFANFCSYTKADSFNYSLSGFQQAIATWYGPPTGVATGGGCGYDADVGKPPYNGFVSAGNPVLFLNGKGCGVCYQVKCTENSACSGAPVTVTMTDSCPGCDGRIHFDLSGIAFGALAKPGQANQLRNAGKINVFFQRAPCKYPRTSIVFKVDKGSNPNYFATLIMYENGDGDIGSVEIQPTGSNVWFPMQEVFGATYKYDVPGWAKAPFSIKLTQSVSRKSIVAQNVIPRDWKPGQYYQSNVNF